MPVAPLLDCFSSQTHTSDHCAAIWLGLDPSERGGLYCTPRALPAFTRVGLRPILVKRVPRRPWPVLIASWGDVPYISGRPFVMVEHGSGQTYQGSPGFPASEPAPDSRPSDCACRMVLLLAPSERVASRNRLHHGHCPSVAVGCPRLDQLVTRNLKGNPDPVAYKGPEVPIQPVVAFTHHWPSPLAQEAFWAFPHWHRALSHLATRDDLGWSMLGHGHPRAWPTLKRFWLRNHVESTRWADVVLSTASVVVADNTSLAWEAMACGIPVIWLDCPTYRQNVEHGLRFWEWADSALRVGSGDPDELREAIETTLQDDPCVKRREEAAWFVYGPLDGRATKRAVAAIRATLAP